MCLDSDALNKNTEQHACQVVPVPLFAQQSLSQMNVCTVFISIKPTVLSPICMSRAGVIIREKRNKSEM